MSANETIAEICEELRSGEYVPLADRIEAAWKRECAALEAQPRTIEEMVHRSKEAWNDVY